MSGWVIMMLRVHGVAPGVSVQDLGRPGWTAQGLSRGGAADRLALLEAAALLETGPDNAVLEMMGAGGTFSTGSDTRIALTGAVMQADIDGAPVALNVTHPLRAGQRLRVGGARQGVFGYLAFKGGVLTPKVMDSRAAHLTAGIGAPLKEGDTIPIGSDDDPLGGPRHLPVVDRLGGGTIRLMPGPQTDFFAQDTLERFAGTSFVRSPRGNRQGVRMDHDGAPFGMDGKPNIASDLIVPGDVQMTGDGVPYVLLSEGQTTGGYPRIGTVIPDDLPKVAQAMPGAPVRFQWLNVAEAEATYRSEQRILRDLRAACGPLTRDPHDIADLLGYQLIGGVTRGDDLERS
ncbi:5-oxoprolinase subunit C family protein [Yoonia sp. 2307UL14-13]|uniref:5-oxoprolinase subunit C family protein n=1 Tax=Yoonia sp. 2307UL14-13 TaxID=3126506 RepID=UPI0030A54C7A